MYYKPGVTSEFEMWHHVAATYKDYVLTLYVDGTMAGNAPNSFYSLARPQINYLLIGNRAGPNATIDDFRYYNAAKDQNFINFLWKM